MRRPRAGGARKPRGDSGRPGPSASARSFKPPGGSSSKPAGSGSRSSGGSSPASDPEPLTPFADPITETLPAELAGEDALRLLPTTRATAPPEEVVYFGDPVEIIDAWGAVALRTSIELYASVQQRNVTVSMPTKTGPCELLHALLRHNAPTKLILPNDSADHKAKVPTNCLIQAQCVPSDFEAEQLAILLRSQASGRTAPAVRMLANFFPTLRLKIDELAGESSVTPVAAAVHERTDDVVQLVITSLGRRSARRDLADLETALTADEDLISMTEHATHRGLDLSLTVAAADKRVAWRGDQHIASQAENVPGVTIALSIQLD